jgi:hypothetical protein
MRTSIRLALAAPFLSLLAACGGDAAAGASPYERGLDQAKAGDHAAAVASYDEALADLEPAAETYMEIQMARIESLTHTDAPKAAIDFLEVADENSELVKPEDFMRVFNWFVQVKDWGQGGKIADTFGTAYPENEELAQRMDTRIQEAIDAGEVSAAQLEMLEGLGYVSTQ